MTMSGSKTALLQWIRAFKLKATLTSIFIHLKCCFIYLSYILWVSSEEGQINNLEKLNPFYIDGFIQLSKFNFCRPLCVTDADGEASKSSSASSEPKTGEDGKTTEPEKPVNVEDGAEARADKKNS